MCCTFTIIKMYSVERFLFIPNRHTHTHTHTQKMYNEEEITLVSQAKREKPNNNNKIITGDSQFICIGLVQSMKICGIKMFSLYATEDNILFVFFPISCPFAFNNFIEFFFFYRVNQKMYLLNASSIIRDDR